MKIDREWYKAIESGLQDKEYLDRLFRLARQRGIYRQVLDTTNAMKSVDAVRKTAVELF